MHATDISSAAVARAGQNAMSQRVSIVTRVADVRTLAQQATGGFDIVLSCDNSLAHPLTDGDLRAAVRSMRLMLNPSGLLLLSVR